MKTKESYTFHTTKDSSSKGGGKGKGKKPAKKKKKTNPKELKKPRKAPRRMVAWGVPFSFINLQDRPATDFHIIFTGTGGTLYYDPDNDITVTPTGHCGEMIFRNGNQMDLYFDPPVPVGGILSFSVVCQFRNIKILEWRWTFDDAPPFPM